MTIGQHLETVSKFQEEYIVPFNNMPEKSGFRDILIPGIHCKWINFREDVKNSYSLINDFIATSLSRNTAAKLLIEKLLSLYCDIYSFIELHDYTGLNTNDETGINYTTRDVTAVEVAEVIKKGIRKITELVGDIQPEIQLQCNKILNDNPNMPTLPVHKAFTTDKWITCRENLIESGVATVENECLIWKSTKALYGYFVAVSSVSMGLREPGGRIPWQHYKCIFKNHDIIESGAKFGVNQWNNEGTSKPKGF